MTEHGVQGVQIRLMAESDWDAVQGIYAQGIATGNATFEEQVPAKADFLSTRIPELRIVAEDTNGDVVGWAAASPTSTRAAYRGVIEHSVYIDQAQAGRGIATQLLQDLISRAQTNGYWTIQSGIFAENTASRALHTKTGFREIGRRERIAQMTFGPAAGQWRDTFLYELRL
ncbi:phosphinothricin acetyltransferase [Arthrobacter alpinus]|uniref:Phosphinothricin acetyltransferase n=1 Tax=Arthrobacter alpinus TaxID=656366 RepID=A0A1H5PDA4_9MICC|nr:GNAT family N-acetyltransferase [Arthrobacter alpinus]SEF11574.1 phosphinothricin acetyltransferase [Arthrobacter alpinus]